MVLSMERWAGKVAIVTGASAGIGAVIVEQLVAEGLKVVGLARRVELMEKTSKKFSDKRGKFYPLKCDVQSEEEILKSFKWIEENLGPVSILINNAGILGNTNLVNGDTDIWKRILDINVLSLCITTREAVKSMRANNISGHIIHINSIAGHKIPYYPMTNVYPASKHAVTALVETLRQEFNQLKLKIKITNLSPGLVRTDMFLGKKWTSNLNLADAIRTCPVLESEDVADAVVYALSTPPHVQVQELLIKPINEIN